MEQNCENETREYVVIHTPRALMHIRCFQKAHSKSVSKHQEGESVTKGRDWAALVTMVIPARPRNTTPYHTETLTFTLLRVFDLILCAWDRE